MTLGKISDLLFGFLWLGGVTVLVTAPNTVPVLTAVSTAFVQSLRTAMGK